MIPVAIRIAISVLGAGLMAASFVVRSSVDRGLQIRHDAPPGIQVDAMAFTLRIVGAFVLMIGLLTWVAAYTGEHHTGIF